MIPVVIIRHLGDYLGKHRRPITGREVISSFSGGQARTVTMLLKGGVEEGRQNMNMWVRFAGMFSGLTQEKDASSVHEAPH